MGYLVRLDKLKMGEQARRIAKFEESRNEAWVEGILYHNKCQSSSLVLLDLCRSYQHTSPDSITVYLGYYASKLVNVLQPTDSESEGTKSQHCRGYSNGINISYLDDNILHSSNINTDMNTIRPIKIVEILMAVADDRTTNAVNEETVLSNTLFYLSTIGDESHLFCKTVQQWWVSDAQVSLHSKRMETIPTYQSFWVFDRLTKDTNCLSYSLWLHHTSSSPLSTRTLPHYSYF